MLYCTCILYIQPHICIVLSDFILAYEFTYVNAYTGMDQNKTNIPNICPTPKALQTTFRLQTHCTGILAHTRSPRGKKAYAIYDICQWSQDANITVYALLHVLLDFTEQFPEVLYLQLDNAGNQNKNRYMLGFCAFLVESRIFRKVCKSFYLHTLLWHKLSIK